MTERINSALAAFKVFVAGIEPTDDTLMLDRMLGEASTLLYDTRHAIDFEWAAARASVVQRPKPISELERTAQRLADLNITAADVEAFLREQGS